MIVDKRKVMIGYYGVEEVDESLWFVNDLKYKFEEDLYECIERIGSLRRGECVCEDVDRELERELVELDKLRIYWEKLENLRILLDIMCDVEEIKEVGVKEIK